MAVRECNFAAIRTIRKFRIVAKNLSISHKTFDLFVYLKIFSYLCAKIRAEQEK